MYDETKTIYSLVQNTMHKCFKNKVMILFSYPVVHNTYLRFEKGLFFAFVIYKVKFILIPFHVSFFLHRSLLKIVFFLLVLLYLCTLWCILSLCIRKQMKNCCASIYVYPCFFFCKQVHVDLEKDWNGKSKIGEHQGRNVTY